MLRRLFRAAHELPQDDFDSRLADQRRGLIGAGLAVDETAVQQFDFHDGYVRQYRSHQINDIDRARAPTLCFVDGEAPFMIGIEGQTPCSYRSSSGTMINR